MASSQPHHPHASTPKFKYKTRCCFAYCNRTDNDVVGDGPNRFVRLPGLKHSKERRVILTTVGCWNDKSADFDRFMKLARLMACRVHLKPEYQERSKRKRAPVESSHFLARADDPAVWTGSLPSHSPSTRQKTPSRGDSAFLRRLERESSEASEAVQTHADKAVCTDTDTRLVDSQREVLDLKQQLLEARAALAEQQNLVQSLQGELSVSPRTLELTTGFDESQMSSVFALLEACSFPSAFDGPGSKSMDWKDAVRLMYTRLFVGCSAELAAHLLRLRISPSAARRTFRNVLDGVATVFRHTIGRKWSQHQVEQNRADCFSGKFCRVRLIADCSATPAENSSNGMHHSHLYSRYYGTTCGKFMIAINPAGYIEFVSKMYGGSTSDVDIARDSRLIDYIEKGHELLYDKGMRSFREDVEAKGAFFTTPYTKTDNQLTALELRTSREISNRRSHVERAVLLVKRYGILTRTMPQATWDIANDILVVCAFSTHFLGPMAFHEARVNMDDGEDSSAEMDDEPQGDSVSTLAGLAC